MNTNETKIVGEAYAAIMELNQKVKTHNRLALESPTRVQVANEVAALQSKFDSLRKMVKDKENRSLLTFLNRTKNKLVPFVSI